MTNRRRTAILTGTALILMAIVAIFSIGYAYPQFDNPELNEFLQENILQKNDLYYSMLIGIFIIIILDFIVSYSLYKYFEEDHKLISLTSGIIRVLYTVIFSVATFHLTKNLFADQLTNEMVRSNFEQFQTIWNSGLVVFGLHILMLGFLMKLHRKIPGILWSITMIAGISYSLVSSLKLGGANTELVTGLNMILALPMIIGEIGLAVWLLIVGGKEKK